MGKTFGSFPIFSYLCTEKRKQYEYHNKKIKSYGKREDDYCSFRHC